MCDKDPCSSTTTGDRNSQQWSIGIGNHTDCNDRPMERIDGKRIVQDDRYLTESSNCHCRIEIAENDSNVIFLCIEKKQEEVIEHLMKSHLLSNDDKIHTCNSSKASFNELRVRLPWDSSKSPNEMPLDRALSQSWSSASSRSLNRVTGYDIEVQSELINHANQSCAYHRVLSFVLIENANASPMIFLQEKFSS